MPHNIKPNKRYRIVTVQLAVEEDTDAGQFADEMSAILTGALCSDDTCLADWGYAVQFEDAPIVESNEDTEEGGLFEHG